MGASEWRRAAAPATACLALVLGSCAGPTDRPPQPAPPQSPPRASAGEQRVASLRASLARSPEDSSLRLALANQLYDLGRHAEAVDQYTIYLTAVPADANARTDMGTCFKRLGNLDRALAEYETVLTANPGHVMTLYNAGIVADLMGQTERARGYFQRAIAADTSGRVASAAEQRLLDIARREGAPEAPAPTGR